MRVVNWQMDSIRLEQQRPSHPPFPPPLPWRAAAITTSCPEADGDRAPPPHLCCSGGVFPRQGSEELFLPPPSPAMVEPGSAPGILLFLTFLRAAELEGWVSGLAGGKMLTHLSRFRGIAGALTQVDPLSGMKRAD